MAPIPEVRTIADRRDNRCCRFGPNAFDPGDTLTGLARFEDGFDFLVEMLDAAFEIAEEICLLYTSPSPRDLSTSRMPSSA